MKAAGAGAEGAHIVLGLPPALRAEAAALYWQVFGGKLGRVMGPDARALAFLDRTIDPGHALVALSPEGRLLGLAGFKTAAGAFAGGSFRDLAAVYGLAGAVWRAACLRLLNREVDNARFLFDGICVARAARGQGIGAALIKAAAVHAATLGYRELRLDVIDTNIRARALYERLGFRAAGVQHLGLLRHVFGFEAAVTMVRGI